MKFFVNSISTLVIRICLSRTHQWDLHLTVWFTKCLFRIQYPTSQRLLARIKSSTAALSRCPDRRDIWGILSYLPQPTKPQPRFSWEQRFKAVRFSWRNFSRKALLVWQSTWCQGRDYPQTIVVAVEKVVNDCWSHQEFDYLYIPLSFPFDQHRHVDVSPKYICKLPSSLLSFLNLDFIRSSNSHSDALPLDAFTSSEYIGERKKHHSCLKSSFGKLHARFTSLWTLKST